MPVFDGLDQKRVAIGVAIVRKQISRRNEDRLVFVRLNRIDRSDRGVVHRRNIHLDRSRRRAAL